MIMDEAVQDVVAALLSPPIPLSAADSPVDRGGVPSEPGLCAWWAPPAAIPHVSGRAHPSADLELLYVGIAPSSASSGARLRSRVLSGHLGENTGASTLRRSLAALLIESEGYRTRVTSRPVLEPDDERRLSQWMHRRLSLTWAVHPEPWSVKIEVINLLQPPLNLAHNSQHPLYETVSDARARWRASARPAGS